MLSEETPEISAPPRRWCGCKEGFPSAQSSDDAQTLQLAPPDAGSVTAPVNVSQIEDVLDEAGSLPGDESVIDPLDLGNSYVSSDGSVALSTLTYPRRNRGRTQVRTALD